MDGVSFVATVNPTTVTAAPVKVKSRDYSEVRGWLQEQIRASYDTISRTPENTRHWQWIDNLSADATLSYDVRKTLREQARYEIGQNNSYGLGMVQTLVGDTIGTGPRLQMQFEDAKLNKQVEQVFQYWTRAINLREKLATLRTAKLIDGEAVGRLSTNLYSGDPVSVDILPIECDQLTAPNNKLDSATYVDGVHIDRFGYPYAYDILTEHPGNNYSWAQQRPNSFNTYNYQQVIHYFRKDRPGQHRGVCELAPSLPLYALLRRFTLATVTAAETAASTSQVIESDAPLPESLEEEYAVTAFGKFLDAVPINRNSATILPNQWKMRQFAAEHPTTTYRMFKQELINEIARVICMPRNVATGDSADYNYASGRLDHLMYQRSIRIEQAVIELEILDRLFAEWLVEAALMDVIPKRLANYVMLYESEYGRRGLASRIPHAWYWDGFEDADKEMSANAQKTKIMNGTTHRAAEYAALGMDVDVEDEKAAKSFGMTVEQYRSLLAASIFSNGNQVNPGASGDPGTNQANADAKQQTATA